MEINLSALKLKLLENGGVDNWEGYDEALGRFYEYEDYLTELNNGEEALTYEDWLEMPKVKHYELKSPLHIEVFDGSDYMIHKYSIRGYGVSFSPEGIDIDESGYFRDSDGYRMTIEEGDAITTDERGKHYLIRKEDFLNNYKEVED